jgi:hypothetical protein
MPNGLVPTIARPSDGLVMFPLKLEREVVLVQSSKTQNQFTHGVTLSRERDRVSTRVRTDRSVGESRKYSPGIFAAICAIRCCAPVRPSTASTDTAGFFRCS